ncbi:type II secretion system GspH family protein, partial [Candidatus Kaiserbacteria bacterium]|nr:type II secretion system GspH family protein [Candidatus Kaiserbacteria bacterium]
IELLVVIAIIGILASVVLASLNSARAKGSDAAIKANLNNARAQAELYYHDNGGTYSGVCSSSNGILPMHDGASEAAGGDSNVACFSFTTVWLMKARLVSNTGQYYCVDSVGNAKVVTGTYTDGSGPLECP